MKYEPKKVFIKENGENVEITYQEHQYRQSSDAEYQKKWFIPVQGYIIETDREHYAEFYKDLERMKYLKKLDIQFGLLSIDYFDSEDDNGTEFLKDPKSDICEQVESKMEIDKLYNAIQLLSAKEKKLLKEYFFDEISQVKLANIYGISQQALSKRIRKIVVKIKNLLKN